MLEKKILHKMKRILLLIVLLFSFSSYGQDDSSIKEKRFFIGVNFSPDYSYRYISKNAKNWDCPDNELWKTIKEFEDSIYIPKFGYTAGINFGFQINEKLSAETGIQYSCKGYKTIPMLTIYDWNERPEKATNFVNYYYFDFPLKINYTFLKKRIKIIVSTGAVINILFQSRTKTIPETPTTLFQTTTSISHYAYNKFNLSPFISAGLQYKINNKMFLRAEPTFRYGIFNIDDKSYEAVHLWSAGLNIGYYIGL